MSGLGPDTSVPWGSSRHFTSAEVGREADGIAPASGGGIIEPPQREPSARLAEKISLLKRLSDELHGILEAIPCGVVTADAQGNITRVNVAAERILGRLSRELTGRDVRTLRDYSGQCVLLLGRDNVKPGSIVERLVSSLDGSVRYLSGSVAELGDGGRLEVISDQTEVSHLRSQVNRLDTLAALGEMAAGVAHEIRNPMNGVEGFSGLLERALASSAWERDKILHYASCIRRGVADVNGIIGNLLLWARPEKPDMHPIALAGVFDDVRRDITELGASVNIRFDCPHESLAVRGDRLKLKLTLLNLIRNACEAVQPEGTVQVGVSCEKDRVVISVDDDGPGVAPEIRRRLFQPFCTSKPEGTGLGLALARKFTEMQGGVISATKSTLGGARFSVMIPKLAEEVAS